MTTHSSPGLTVRAACSLLAGVAVLALPGCGSGEDGKASTPTPRAAADGTDLNACKDGTCEVKVTGPVTLPVDRKKFKIGKLETKPEKDDTVSFTITDSGNSFTSVQVCGTDGQCFDLGGGGYSSGGDGQSGRSSTSWTAGAGTRTTANGIVITVLSAADGSAILRVTPA
ncbi:hypothetical protein ACQPZP_10175 [Spirillospora sp. CA-142024]|uniref:hypothetical protein n=1 Tax=Spirillospora sp. CA-142024 TaxID=3240036 RepID=UPI003D8CA684